LTAAQFSKVMILRSVTVDLKLKIILTKT